MTALVAAFAFDQRPDSQIARRSDAIDQPTGYRARIEFGLLGPLEVLVDGRAILVRSPKLRTLLTTLLLYAGRAVSIEDLVDATWGSAQPNNPRRAVQLCVTRLRALLAATDLAPSIATCTDGYRIDARPNQLDIGRFHLWLEQAHRARERADLDAEAAALSAALAQWRGEPLADIPSDLLQREVAPQLRERRLQTFEQQFDVDLRRGRHADLVSKLFTLTAQHPLRERLWAQLMTSLHGSERRAAALDAYHVVRKQLADELGIDPSEELQNIHALILAGRSQPMSEHTGLPPIPRQIPADLRGFTGRVEELANLDAFLAGQHETAAPKIGLITGTAGIGKTTLAVHWARRVADRFPDGQLWVSLRGYDPGQLTAPEQALTRFLRALGVADAQIPVDPVDKIGLYKSLMDGRRMLIVLDNANGPEHVRPLLPGALGCMVLVTSRNQLTSLVSAEAASPLTLDLLSFDEARRLLARRLGVGRVEAEPAAVDEIIGLCAGLPLALAIVAARAATHRGFGLDIIASELRATVHNGLVGFTSQDAATRSRAALSWSYQALNSDTAQPSQVGHSSDGAVCFSTTLPPPPRR